jgi:hypothetical protein
MAPGLVGSEGRAQTKKNADPYEMDGDIILNFCFAPDNHFFFPNSLPVNAPPDLLQMVSWNLWVVK